MRFRFSMTALGLAAALLALDASDSYVKAQTPADTAAARRRAAARRAAARRAALARARSERAIGTTGKEIPLEAIARTDTVYQFRSDTVFQYRTDTVTVTRVDSVQPLVAPGFPTVRMGGFYLGLGGGLTAPRQELNTTFDPGFNITGMLGWDPIGSPFGIRLDAAYDQFSEESEFEDLAADPSIFSAHLNAKLRFPFFGMETGSRTEVYAVGGGSYYRYRNLWRAEEGTTAVECVREDGPCDEWGDDFGWNVGGGIGFGFGPSKLFLEARWMGLGSNTSFVPIILGLTF